MLDTMYDAPGIGLAAPQIGELKRIVVMDLAKEGDEARPDRDDQPEILSYSDETDHHRGRLPLDPRALLRGRAPGRGQGEIHRPRRQDRRARAKDRLAICIQHELDHLDGVLYIDYLSRLKRDRVLKKFQKQASAGRADLTFAAPSPLEGRRWRA
jgi:peptide deformylase